MKTKEEIYAAIKEASKDGLMPTAKQWNEIRPEGMPYSGWIIKKHGKRWGQIAKALNLRLQTKKSLREVEEKKQFQKLAAEKWSPRETPLIKPRPEPRFKNPKFLLWGHVPYRKNARSLV